MKVVQILLLFLSLGVAAEGYQRVPLKVIQETPLTLPEGNRVAFGWKAVGMNPGDSVTLKPTADIQGKHHWLRVTVAQEIWDANRLRVTIPNTNLDLGALDINFSSVLVPYEVKIPHEHLKLIEQHGLQLELESATPFWFFESTASGAEGLAVHLMSSDRETGTIDEFLDCFQSLNAIQAFGWREGTVLDGLWQLHAKLGSVPARQAIDAHLNLFSDASGNIVYENARSRPSDGHIDGIESTIPFATLGRVDPDHPFLKRVVAGWEKLKKPDGIVIDGQSVTAEGCYTVGYPMAVLGNAWNDKGLQEWAVAQLRHRFVLVEDESLYLRYYRSGRYTYRNWARGAAWWLLGVSKTMEELGVEAVDQGLVVKFQEAVNQTLALQREDALWSCFMHEPETSLPDASGSAGISAAILTGIRLGILSESHAAKADACYQRLLAYLTPDGFLKGVAQDNRGGEGLQRSDYRVIAQMGMGMLAQLYAEKSVR